MNMKVLTGALGATCLLFAANSHAGYSWNFTSTSPNSNPPGIALGATGYHQDTSSSNFIERPLIIYSGDHLSLNYDNNKPNNHETAPFHAFDNDSGYDLVVFEFAKPVTISQVTMGWWQLDADFSLFAFEPVPPGTTPGAGAPPGSGQFSYTGMVNDGWELIGSFDYDNYASVGNPIDIATLTANGPKNVLDYSSSYWAIGAVMDAVAATGPRFGVIQEGGGWGDRFKIASIAGVYTDIPPPPNTAAPEPTSLALMALGLAGGLRLRKRSVARRA